MDEENEYTLTRYYTSSPDSLIERVAPCLRAGKIEVVHYCCDHVAIAPGEMCIRDRLSFGAPEAAPEAEGR